MKHFLGIVLAAVSACLLACSDPYEGFEDNLDDSVVTSLNYLNAYLETLDSSSSTKSSSSEADSSSEKSSSSGAKSSSSEGEEAEASSSSGAEVSSSAAASSSSGVSSYSALSEERTISFELYEYAQVSANWDGSDDDYEDGDPVISFTILLISVSNLYGSDTTTLETGALLELEDTGSWSGSVVYEGVVPAGTSVISVCPSVVDVDELSDDDKSSGECVNVYDVGDMADETFVYQSDETEDYELYWNWFLFEDV